ncbi:hypothetical protein Avbf_02996 [Armadillidium vulgare]|nr:hypothetical protein Avbf_02996 [Armadillidium vulgare]
MRIADRYQDIGSEHYEDILATATLNKVLEICESVHQEERERQGVDIGGGSLEHGGTDTDSGLSGDKT